jgi:hypothetical protein
MTDPWLRLDEVVDLDAITDAAQVLIDPLGEPAILNMVFKGMHYRSGRTPGTQNENCCWGTVFLD